MQRTSSRIKSRKSAIVKAPVVAVVEQQEESDNHTDTNSKSEDENIDSPTSKPVTLAAKKTRQRNVVVKLDLDDLWACVTIPKVNMLDIVRQWTNAYHLNQNKALLSATGCPHTITSAQFEDYNAVLDYIEELETYMPTDMRLYPLITRTKQVKAHLTSFFTFFSTLLANDDKSLWDQVCFEIIQSWLATMSSSHTRALRHTATSLTLHLVTGLCPHLNNPNHTYKPVVEEVYKAMYESVFMHRYRDVDPVIRQECMRALSTWVTVVPDLFLNPTHLRYFGWYLNDKDASVRQTVLACISNLYKNTSIVPGLHMFTERFKVRVLEMAVKDVDLHVQRAAIETLCLVYAINGLDQAETDTLCTVVFAASGVKVSDAVVGVWQAESEPMDLTQFVSWLATLLTLVYPDICIDSPEEMAVMLAKHTNHAVVHLVQSMPTLAVFTDAKPWLGQLRRTDVSVANDHLMLSVISAMASTSSDLALDMGPQIVPLLNKYQADNVAETFLFKCLCAIASHAWSSPPMSNQFESIVRCGHQVFERGADADVLANVSQLFCTLSNVPGLDVDMRSHIRTLLTDGCAPDRPRTYLELLRLVKVPDDLTEQVSDSVAQISDALIRIQVLFVMAVQAQVLDSSLVLECEEILMTEVDEQETELVQVKVLAANILLESYCVFPESPAQLSDQVLGCLETIVTTQVRNELFVLNPKESLPVSADHRDFPTTDLALVNAFAKALATGVIDGAYTATLLQFYQRPSLKSSELSTELADTADAILFPKVLVENVSETTLVQVCLSSLQRAFQLSEFDMHQSENNELGVPDRPNAVPKLARALVTVFKHRKAINSAKQVIDYGAQWLIDRFQPLVPSVPITQDDTTSDSMEPHPDSEEYALAVAEYHQQLATAIVHAGPLIRGLREFVTLLNKPTAIELYRKFHTAPILDVIMIALARKAEVKHKHAGSTSISRQSAGSVSKKKGGKQNAAKSPRAKKVGSSITTVPKRASARRSTRHVSRIEPAVEEVDEGSVEDDETELDHQSGPENGHAVLPTPIRDLKRTSDRISRRSQSIELVLDNGILDPQVLDVQPANTTDGAGLDDHEEEEEEFAPSPSPKRRRMI